MIVNSTPANLFINSKHRLLDFLRFKQKAKKTKTGLFFCLFFFYLIGSPLYATHFPVKDSTDIRKPFFYEKNTLTADYFQEYRNILKTDPDPETKKHIAKAIGAFEEVEKTGNITELLDPNDMTSLPVGIKENMGTVEYALVVTKVKFTSEYALINVYVRIKTPQQGVEGGKKEMYFGAEEIKLSYQGKIVGNTKLSLLGDVNMVFNNKEWMLTLEGGSINKSNGESYNNNTFVVIDCNGVKGLSLKGNVQISRNVLLPIDDKGKIAPETINVNGKSVSNRVRGDFQITATDWNDLLVKIKINPFAITSQAKNPDKGYFSFFVNEAILDMSDLRTDPKTVFPTQYSKNGYLISGVESWRGLYIETLSVGLPQEIKTTEKLNTPVILEAKNLLIDNYGVSGSFAALNLFPLEKGVTNPENAWRYSIDKIGVDLAASKIVGANIEGTLQLPIQENNSNSKIPNSFGYKGVITEEEYLIAVKTTKDIDFNIWSAKATIDSGSMVEFKVKNREFLPRAVLNGSLELLPNSNPKEQNSEAKPDGHFKGVKFQGLVLQTKSPFVRVDYFGAEGEFQLGNFPVSISDIKLIANDNEASLGLTITVGLQQDKFSASGGIFIKGKIKSEDRKQKWVYDGFQLYKLSLKNVDVGVALLSGTLELMKDDPLYGKGFKANLKAKLTELNNVEVLVNAYFGKSSFRYWGFEGRVDNLKIPIGGGVNITGFSGGAFYKMLPDRELSVSNKNAVMVLLPNEAVGLAMRAGVIGSIGDKSLASFMAGFSISTNSNGGLANIGFMGEAVIMSEIEAISPNPMAKVQDKFRDMMGMPKFMDDLKKPEFGSKNLDTSQVQNSYPLETNVPASMYAKMAMDYDFNNRIFHANLDVFVNAANGVLKGTGPGGRAGWAVMHIAPKEWYLHIGTPSDMIGLRIGVGGFALQSGSYFMVGTKIPASPPPPIEVAEILGLQLSDIDYMKDLNALGDGKGVAFGTHFKFDTGDLTALFLYARFQAGIGGDVMLKNYGEVRCSNRASEQIGIDGWYANGQAYVYLQGELGIKIKLFFIKKKIPIIKAGAAALLQAKGPNPFWMRGYLGGHYNLLGGMIKGRFRFKLEFGEKCELQNESVLGGMKIITDFTPKNSDTNISVFGIPQATFALRVNEPIVLPEDDGDHTYKVIIDKMILTDSDGNLIKGRIEFPSKDVANFVSEDILPPGKTLKARVQVSFMEKINGMYQVLMVDGQKATELEERTFTTGSAPNEIPLTNIQYNYPVVNQENFYTNEKKNGYIKLKRGQDYLFDDTGWESSFVLKQENQTLAGKFVYNNDTNEVLFEIPSLEKQKQYFFALIAKSKNNSPIENTTITKTETFAGEEEDSSISNNQETKVALNLAKEGEIQRLAFQFKTSKYNSFKEKMEAIQFSPAWIKLNSDVVALQNNMNFNEYFDLTELVGSSYTDNKPLIDITAIMNEAFAQKFKNLFYINYPLDQIQLERQEDENDKAGIPPTRALPIFSSYLQYLDKEKGNVFLKQTFPYQYNLFYYFKKDWYEMVSKAASKYVTTASQNRPNSINTLIQSDFGAIPKGIYKVEARYILPGNKSVSNKIFNYEYR